MKIGKTANSDTKGGLDKTRVLNMSVLRQNERKTTT